jgi:plasmid stability protein
MLAMDDQRTTTATFLTIRKLDAALKERLRIRAAHHGHSMEAEVRDILKETLKEPEPPSEPHLYESIRARFAPLGGADDIELPPREPVGDPPRFN